MSETGYYCKMCKTENPKMFEDDLDSYCVPCGEEWREIQKEADFDDEFPFGTEE